MAAAIRVQVVQRAQQEDLNAVVRYQVAFLKVQMFGRGLPCTYQSVAVLRFVAAGHVPMLGLASAAAFPTAKPCRARCFTPCASEPAERGGSGPAL